jgi:hypothetical protein
MVGLLGFRVGAGISWSNHLLGAGDSMESYPVAAGDSVGSYPVRAGVFLVVIYSWSWMSVVTLSSCS